MPMASASGAKTRPPIYRCKPVLRLLIIALLAELGYAVMNISTMPVYLKEDRNFGASTIGLVFAAYLFCEAAFKGPMGHLADKYGPKRLMMAGPAISVCTAILSIVVPHQDASPAEIGTFIALRMCDGLGAAMLWPAAFAAMNEAVGDEDRQQAMSLLNLCYLLGIAIAFEFGGIADELTGTTYAGLVLAAGCFLAVSVCVYRFLPDIHPAQHLDTVHSTSLSDMMDSIRKIPEYMILASVVFVGIGLPVTIFKIFPADQFGFSEVQIGSLICPGAIVMGVASIPMAHYADRIGRVRAVHLGLFLCTVGMGIIGSAALIKFLRIPWLLAFGAIPTGIGFLLAIPAWMASVSDIDPAKRGSNLGAVMTAQGIGAIVGAPLGAAMYEKLQPIGREIHLGDAFGRYSPFLLCAICVGAGWLLSLRILHAKSSSEPPALDLKPGGAALSVGRPDTPPEGEPGRPVASNPQSESM